MSFRTDAPAKSRLDEAYEKHEREQERAGRAGPPEGAHISPNHKADAQEARPRPKDDITDVQVVFY